jgi:hypothetical protein
VYGAYSYINRCVFHTCRQIGLWVTGTNSIIVECEAYGCNVANTASYGGFYIGGISNLVLRCNSHDNGGNIAVGFFNDALGCRFIGCIAESNGGDGMRTSSSVVIQNCDFYNNGLDGLDIANTNAYGYYIENCNFVKNGGYGINGSGSGSRHGAIVNCGFGVGTQANSSGNFGTTEAACLKSMVNVGQINYATGVTPWNDPANGDFSLTLAAARGTGRGTMATFTSAANPTVSKPDVGAASRGGTVPVAANTRVGVQYGAAGTEFTGTVVVPGEASNSAAPTGTGVVLLHDTTHGRTDAGHCCKMTPPVDKTTYGYWDFYVPVTDAASTFHFWWAKSHANFGSDEAVDAALKVSLWEPGDAFNATPGLAASHVVDITSADTDYHEESIAFDATTAGLMRVRVELKDGTTAGFLYIDDISVVVT